MKLNEHPIQTQSRKLGKKLFPSQQEYLMFIKTPPGSLEKKGTKKMSCTSTKMLAFRLYRKGAALLPLLLKSRNIEKDMNKIYLKNHNSTTFI